jgi:hypothetical protein
MVSLGFVLAPGPASAQVPARWRLTPDVRFGQDAQRSYDFTRIIAVLPATDGSLFIADSRNKEISVFSPTGAYVQSIGRNGRGPGEFELMRSAGLFGDTLWVIDWGERRTSLFARDGRVLATIPLESEASASGSARWIGELVALLPDGAALGVGGSPVRALEKSNQPAPVLRMTRGGRTLDTLAWVQTKNETVWLSIPDGSFIIGRQAFADAALTVPAPNAPVLFIVDRSVTTKPDTSRFRVVALESNGDTLWNRSYAYVPLRVEKVRADSFSTAWERHTRRGVTTAEIRRVLFIPEYYSPVTSAFAGADGSLWLRREEAKKPTVDYWVLDKDGRLVAALTVPANLTLMAATTSKTWGVEKDEYDVPTVVRYSIQR